MYTLNDFQIEIMRVREAINDLMIKGEHNASLIVYSVGKCNDMINEIQKALQEKTEGQKESEEVNKDGEQDSGVSE